MANSRTESPELLRTWPHKTAKRSFPNEKTRLFHDPELDGSGMDTDREANDVIRIVGTWEKRQCVRITQ